MKKALFALALARAFFTSVQANAATVLLQAGTNTNSLGLQTETFDSPGLPAGSPSNNGAGASNFGSTLLPVQRSPGLGMRGSRMGSLAG